MIYWEKADGGFILITFTESLIGAFTGNQSHFTVSWNEYDFVPDGTLVPKTGTVLATYIGEDDTQLVLEMVGTNRFNNAVGQITVTYDGAGSLAGEGGAVEAFEISFTPTGLVPKPNQSDQNHIEIVVATKTGVLTRIYYTGTKTSEHLSVSATWTGVLTHIDDL